MLSLDTNARRAFAPPETGRGLPGGAYRGNGRSMDFSPFAITLIVVALPLVGLLALAAWLAERRVGRIRIVDRQGRTLAEVALGRGPAKD